MNTKLYNKMTDDERLQYIWELENYNDNLEHLNYAKNDFIETQEQLYRISKEYAHEEAMKCNAFNRLYDYKKAMQKKYDIYPTPICDDIGEEKCSIDK